MNEILPLIKETKAYYKNELDKRLLKKKKKQKEKTKRKEKKIEENQKNDEEVKENKDISNQTKCLIINLINLKEKSETVDNMREEVRKESKPELSEETIKKLKMIKDNINTKSNKEKNVFSLNDENHKSQLNLLSSITDSLAFKFSQLIQFNKENKLILPPSFLILYKKFEELDKLINNFKMIEKPLRYDEIMKNSKRKLTLTDFKKILFIVPHLFSYKYFLFSETNKGLYVNISDNKRFLCDIDHGLITNLKKEVKETNSSDDSKNYYETLNYFENLDYKNLQLSFSNEGVISSTIINKRLNDIKTILIYMTIKEHNKLFPNFDPIKYKTWHSEFNLDSFDYNSITEANLYITESSDLSRIKNNNGQMLSSFLLMNNIKEKLYEIELEKISKSSKSTCISNISDTSNISSTDFYKEKIDNKANEYNKLSINPTYSSKDEKVFFSLSKKMKIHIEAKEKANKEIEEIRKYSKMNKNPISIDLLEAIYVILIGDVSNQGQAWIIYDSLISKIEKNQKTSHLSKDIINKELENICNIHPKVIRLSNHSDLGRIVIFDKLEYEKISKKTPLIYIEDSLINQNSKHSKEIMETVV